MTGAVIGALRASREPRGAVACRRRRRRRHDLLGEHRQLLYARIEPIGGREIEVADGIAARVTHKVLIRYRDDVTAGMRFAADGRLLDIHAVLDLEGRHRWLQVPVRGAAAMKISVNVEGLRQRAWQHGAPSALHERPRSRARRSDLAAAARSGRDSNASWPSAGDRRRQLPPRLHRADRQTCSRAR